MIDLHTHTTASDGVLTPEELVGRAAEAGVQVLSITDHDTVAGCDPAAAASRRAGIELVPGIEITAVMNDRDIHVLGYFIDAASARFQGFLAEQRRRRIDRVRQIVARLAEHGIALDADAILAPSVADSTKAAGRPWIARALVEAGHVANSDEAFDRWLARGRPGFVPRLGASPEEVIGRIHEAAGIASLAHPALVKTDAEIPRFAAAGLDAIEAYHSEHDAADVARYLQVAADLGLAVSGGSDFHGNGVHGPIAPGKVSLPREAFEKLKERRWRRA